MPILNPERATAALNKLFLALPLPSGNSDPNETLRLYFEVCQGYSNDDIDLAVRQFIAGTIKGVNPGWAPTTAQFSVQLRENLNYRADQVQKRNHLIAQFKEQELDEEWQAERTPEMRAKVAAMLDSFKKGREEKTPEEIAEAKEMLRRHDNFYADQFIETDSGIPVSQYLVSKLRSEGE